MKLEEREAIRARADAATPGPWEMRDRWQVTSASCNICGTSHSHTMHDGGRSSGQFPPQPDAEFIAHARQDVPSLLDQLTLTEHLLNDALELCEELIGYVPEYFREKWGHDEDLATLRAGIPLG